MRGLIFSLLLLVSLGSFAFPASSNNNAAALFQHGVSAMQRADYANAIADFSLVIQLQGNVAGAYSNRCLAQIELGNYTEAIADCDRAISLHPYAEAYLNRGMARYQLHHSRIAIADFTAAIALDSNCAEAYLNRGISRSERGELAAGLDDLAQARQLFALRDNNQPILAEISILIWQFQQENSRTI
jgi:tetratricopeptide (TPR) repeat protein